MVTPATEGGSEGHARPPVVPGPPRTDRQLRPRTGGVHRSTRRSRRTSTNTCRRRRGVARTASLSRGRSSSDAWPARPMQFTSLYGAGRRSWTIFSGNWKAFLRPSDPGGWRNYKGDCPTPSRTRTTWMKRPVTSSSTRRRPRLNWISSGLRSLS